MKSCMIVDDSAVIRKIIRNVMEKLGFDCSDAENGQIAYNYCSGLMPDLIMLDWNMPVMNGLEFLQKLRVLPSGNLPVVIFCTTENDMAHIQMAMDAGASDFIMKPFDNEILRTKLVQNGLIEDTASS